MGAALDYKALRVMALGGVLFSSVEGASGEGGDFTLALGALLVCGRRVLGTFAAALCAGAEVGQLTGTGTGISNPRSGSSGWLAPRADLGLELPLGGDFAFYGRLGATVPTVRKEFVVDDETLVHRPAAVTGRLALAWNERMAARWETDR